MMEKSIDRMYMERLERWLGSIAGAVYKPGKGVACYGPGNSGHWSIQANATALGALMVVAADPGFQSGVMSRDEVLETGLGMLRFMLRGHLSGRGSCCDGRQWGNSWISALSVERMMHGVEAVREHLDAELLEGLRGMLLSESDWLTDKYSIEADIDAGTGRNRPESNIWNGTILHRCAMMYPDAPRAGEYRERGTAFLLNGISVPSDAQSGRIVDGKALSDWHVGANFTEGFGLNHHGYMNVGYMVICLSNIAMLHFSCKARGIAAPEALYHHAEELWKLVKLCTFADGRLWRVGGDSRVRYCYCQDYAVPAWLLALDKFNDRDAAEFEHGWLRTVAMEHETNADGTFMGGRLRELEEVSPLYFRRLEGDKAASLSMGAYWRRLCPGLPEAGGRVPELTGSWSDDFHGAMLERNESRAASFVWKSCQGPCGQCVSPEDSSLAEWRWNMTGEILGCSAYNFTKVKGWTHEVVKGGFHSCGELEWWSANHVAEGQADELCARERLVFAALPDGRTVLVMQHAETVNRCFLRSVKGLFLNVPNDIFNGGSRKYSGDKGEFTASGIPEASGLIDCGSDWLVVDGRLGVRLAYGAETLMLSRPAGRQVEIFDINRHTYGRSGGNLHCDEICASCKLARGEYEAGTVLFDLGFVVSTGDGIVKTERVVSADSGMVRGLRVTGADGVAYLFAANFGSVEGGFEGVRLSPGSSVLLAEG